MRKTVNVTIDAEGRDKGKVFVVTEMPVWDVDKLAIRVLVACANAGAQIPDDVVHGGLVGLLSMGPVRALALVPYDTVEVVVDRMNACIQIQPSPGVIRALVPDDIEESATLVKLQRAVWDLHVTPFMKGAPWTSAPQESKTHDSPVTPTSREASA